MSLVICVNNQPVDYVPVNFDNDIGCALSSWYVNVSLIGVIRIETSLIIQIFKVFHQLVNF